MASLSGIDNPENEAEISIKKRERAALILEKKAEKLRICGGFNEQRIHVNGVLQEEIDNLENTCVITGTSCEMEHTGGNYQRRESYYKCKNCDKRTTHGGRKKKTKRKKSMSKRKTKKRRKKRKTRRRKTRRRKTRRKRKRKR